MLKEEQWRGRMRARRESPQHIPYKTLTSCQGLFVSAQEEEDQALTHTPLIMQVQKPEGSVLKKKHNDHVPTAGTFPVFSAQIQNISISLPSTRAFRQSSGAYSTTKRHHDHNILKIPVKTLQLLTVLHNNFSTGRKKAKRDNNSLWFRSWKTNQFNEENDSLKLIAGCCCIYSANMLLRCVCTHWHTRRLCSGTNTTKLSSLLF